MIAMVLIFFSFSSYNNLTAILVFIFFTDSWI